jgi:hypothetical protein
MSNPEEHPEIREDLDYLFECDDYRTWLVWEEFYRDVPNVQVILKGEQ